MFIKRVYFDYLLEALERGKVVALIGARQTGKTTLLRQMINHLSEKIADFKHHYFFQDLDSLEIRNQLLRDNKFLEKQISEIAGRPLDQLTETFFLFLDEVQKLPGLFEIIKGIHDRFSALRIVVTGSSSLQILDQGAESLAGRIEYHYIFPLTFLEGGFLREEGVKSFSRGDKKGWIEINPDTSLLTQQLVESLIQGRLDRSQLEGIQAKRVWFNSVIREDEGHFLVSGLYPEVVSKVTREEKFRILENYVTTYVERDVRNLANISDWQGYYRLLEVLASRVGQLLDYGKIGTEVGFDARTIKKYLSILEQTFVTFSLPSYSVNVERRVAKSPKIFFHDNGILSRLLKITELKHYESLDWMGKIFENAIVAELLKYLKNRPLPTGLYFWRTYTGTEVDCVVESEGQLVPIEIKSSFTLEEKDWSGLRSFQREFNRVPRGYLLYRGEEPIYRQDERLVAIPYHMIFC